MSTENNSQSYSAPPDKPINNYNPQDNPESSPPRNIKDFAERRIVIHEAEISVGKDYDMAKMVITVDESQEQLIVASYSKFIISAVRDMISRQALPCQVRLATSGKALYFKQA